MFAGWGMDMRSARMDIRTKKYDNAAEIQGPVPCRIKMNSFVSSAISDAKRMFMSLSIRPKEKEATLASNMVPGLQPYLGKSARVFEEPY
jgi:hypothetical protein